jgi:membrane protease subunit HflC
MEAEREQDAKQLRSQGEAEAVRIRARADRESVETIAVAKQKSQQIRGQGDATATDTYAAAYTKNPEFYGLYRSLNAYKEIFKDPSDVLLIQPDSEFFKYFKHSVAK